MHVVLSQNCATGVCESYRNLIISSTLPQLPHPLTLFFRLGKMGGHWASKTALNLMEIVWFFGTLLYCNICNFEIHAISDASVFTTTERSERARPRLREECPPHISKHQLTLARSRVWPQSTRSHLWPPLRPMEAWTRGTELPGRVGAAGAKTPTGSSVCSTTYSR